MSKAKKIQLVCGCAVVAFFCAMALFPQLFSPYGTKDMFERWQEPSAEHLLGTNDMGYDIFTELVHGAGETLLIGISAGLAALTIGTIFGIAAAAEGFSGRLFDGITNVFAALPRLLCVTILAAFVGSSAGTRIFVIALFGWVGTAKQVRAKTVSVKNSVFVQNCVVNGYGKLRIAFGHVLPNIFDVLSARLFVALTSAVMTESSLSFLGIGDLYRPTWGTMINLAIKRGAFFHKAYCWLLLPAVCIALVAMGFYLISAAINRNET